MKLNRVNKFFLVVCMLGLAFVSTLMLAGCKDKKDNKGGNATLSAPVISVDSHYVKWNAVENATSYDVYSAGAFVGNVTTLKADLEKLGLTSSSEITVKAKATGYTESAFSNAASYTHFNDLSVRTYTGSNGVVAAASAYAAKAGLRVLEQGGNAFDAAIAVGFALGVVEPNASGIGGGGIMVAWDATEGQFVGYNYREVVPSAATAANFKNGIASEAVKTGAGNLSVSGIPTLVAALCGIYEDRTSGNVTLEDCLIPAIDYAENGFIVPKELAAQMTDNWSVCSSYNSDYAWEVFSEDGFEPGIKEGGLLVQKDYANTLKLIAEDSKIPGHNGAAGFYTGQTAQAMLASNGLGVAGNFNTTGLMQQCDFDYVMENYPEAMTVDNTGLLKTTYNGYNICTAGIPSSGGVIMIEALNALQSYFGTDGLRNLGHNSAEYINAVQTALYLGYSDKKKYIADLRHDNQEKNYVKVLTNVGYAAERFAKYYKPGDAIDYSSTSGLPGSPTIYAANNGITLGYYSDEIYNDYAMDEHYSTTAYSVADKDGNIVSVTQTLNHFWGTGVMPEGTGFYMNNNLTSITTSSSSLNRVKAYKNPVSHIMPTIVTDSEDNPVLTLGSPGSFRIPAAVLNTLLNVLDFGMDIQTAIDSARAFIYPDSDHVSGGIEVEVYKDLTPEVVAQLESFGWDITVKVEGAPNLYFGGVQGIMFNADGTLTGGADPRRDGKALGY